jgi:hypothetical protein
MAQAPPPNPLDEPGVPIGENLFLLLVAGISYSFRMYYQFRKQIKNINH